MFGAIIGDYVGSRYEGRGKRIKHKGFPLFSDDCRFTDDTIMTEAVAEALMQGEDFAKAMKRWGNMYPNAGYGGMFKAWLAKDGEEPYNSYGNGSAMRVSPVGWWCDTLEETEALAEISAAVTHNHPEGVKGAQAVASAIYLARTKAGKDDIKKHIDTKYRYDLDWKLEEIRPKYRFNSTCQGSVPEAIIAFLEAEDFEDAVRNAVSLGGDADTQAAIAGSIAEAYYGIPKHLQARVVKDLDEHMRGVVERWEKYLVMRKK